MSELGASFAVFVDALFGYLSDIFAGVFQFLSLLIGSLPLVR